MASADDLSDLLKKEFAAVERVLAALEAEQAALQARDAEALSDAARLKADAVEQAGVLEQERREMMALQGYLSAPDPRIESRLEELRTLARRCRELNESNGALIRGQRRRVEGTLRALTGSTVTETYGRDGSSQSGIRSRGPIATW